MFGRTHICFAHLFWIYAWQARPMGCQDKRMRMIPFIKLRHPESTCCPPTYATPHVSPSIFVIFLPVCVGYKHANLAQVLSHVYKPHKLGHPFRSYTPCIMMIKKE
ncbi:hypothetical protein BCR43DRAFT_349924 [Syncephalastrum racemosum]|uniref:Secreted protein n=1 Tax=Syncephalastrum racemosum TaxID=13706 RepID=A0A1X2H660_SYNRA|nr:hypothetical protein BCR43DRAFT_349924 [Syncephalastrum racemosum]